MNNIIITFPHLVFPGGALKYTLATAAELARPHRITLVTLQHDPVAVPLPAGVGVVSVGGPLTSSLFYWLLFPYWQVRLMLAMRRLRPDVIVAQVFPANWWAWLHGRLCHRVRVVWVCHEPSAFIHSAAWIAALRPPWKRGLARFLNPVLKRLDVWLARRTDVLVCNSRHTAAACRCVYGLEAAAIAYPAVDAIFNPETVETKGNYLLTVGHLSHFKRVDFLLEVMVGLRQAEPGLELYVVGEGEARTELAATAARLGIIGRVRWLGRVADADMPGLYRGAQLYLQGSVDEPFGMAPVEAMACGTPVVAHASGGPLEFVTPANGALVASEEVAVWVTTVTELLGRVRAGAFPPATVAASVSAYTWAETARVIESHLGASPLP